VQQNEADKRLALDTVVKGLELTAEGGAYAPQAKIAGALAALVHLGHPVIAMRTLDSAWDDGAVDAATGCWLISEVYRTGSRESIVEASRLLRTHAKELSELSNQPGEFEWPSAIYDQWPINLPRDARVNNLISAIDVLLSRDETWWRHNDSWFIVLLNLIMQHEKDEGILGSAATVAKELLEFRQDYFLDRVLVVENERIDYKSVLNSAATVLSTNNMTVSELETRLEMIREWTSTSPSTNQPDTPS
jgi:hypothetical protein